MDLRENRVSQIGLVVRVVFLGLVMVPPLFSQSGVSSVQSNTTCSARLQDGRSLITGGRSTDGPLTSAKLFGLKGGFTTVAPMLGARMSHFCIALSDETVLVAGGYSGKAVLNSAEIYHFKTNTWDETLPLLTARRGAAAVLLKNGKALIIGGEANGRVIDTLEFYDPVSGRFEQAPGVLAIARTRYAVTVLDDGRVLIAGGLQDGRALDTLDIYDPELGVRFAGRMLVARANLTATTLADGKVLLLGGTDGTHELAAAEIFDPVTGDVVSAEPLATPRQNHIAVRSRSSDVVLIAGGMADGGEVMSAELYIPQRNAFVAASETTDDKETPTITVGSLNADSTLRRARTYRIPRPASDVP